MDSPPRTHVSGVAAEERSARHLTRTVSVPRRWLQRLFTAKQLYECLQPLLFVTYAHGITPFYVYRDRRDGIKKLKKSVVGYMNGLVHVVVYIVCYVLTLTNDGETVTSYYFKTSITSVGNMMQIFSGFFGVVIIYITAIVPKQRLEHSLEQIHLMDHHLRSFGVKIMYSKVLRFSYVTGMVMLLVNVSYCLGNFALLRSSAQQPSFALYVTFVLQHTVVSAAVVLFVCITKMLEKRFDMMHEVLKNLSHQCDTRIIKNLTHKQRSLQCLDSFSLHTIVTKNPSDIIQESMEIHQLICDAASTANKYFTYQLLTIISIAFLIIVFDAYYVLETLLGKSKRESKFKTAEFVTFFSCQMILYLIAIVSIVEGSNRAIKKSEKTASIVHSLLNKAGQTLDIKEKLQQFSMQLLHLKINFTAAGLFNIDRTLYFTISGALTTYLIILLQFTSNNGGAAGADLGQVANDNKTIN